MGTTDGDKFVETSGVPKTTSSPEPAGEENAGGKKSVELSKNSANPLPIVPTDGELLEFQPDAVVLEHRALPGGARWTLYMVLGLIATLILWASLAQVDRIVTTRGELVTTASTIVVQPLTTSVIRTLDAKVGEVVEAGRTLATLDPTFSESDVVKLRERLESVTHAVTRLQKELDGEPLEIPAPDASPAALIEYQIYSRRQMQYKNAMDASDNDIRQLEAKLETNRHHRKSYREHVAVLRKIEKMHQEMARANQGSNLALLEARAKRVEIQSESTRLERQKTEIEHGLASKKANREAFVGQWMQETGTELAKQRLEKISIEEELNKAERVNSLVTLTSPVEAVVLEVAERSVGSVMREAETLVTLVPVGVPLEAEVEIPSKDIGRIRVGDSVRVKLDPFQYQKYGTLEGEVRTVSGDAFTRDIPGSKQVFFRARIALLTTRLKNVPDDFMLSPGMTLTGEINIGQRRVISYFIYPLIRALDESIREP
uniref:Membrane fusion protein (MFP) family protein n=1 Tax=Candidatus Kentrum sp. FW TaxID=2126338 RepID=A0A450TXB0_9GAMM|nr:MAG: HlyD family secretion protein [Candidatus Kentron sp. FW]